MHRHIGILALQGDFSKHMQMLHSLDVKTSLIKKPEDLQSCDGLIIPGGESTTMTKLIHRYDLYTSLQEFGRKYPIMGTCAGMIMVAKEVDDARVKPLQLIDIRVNRNAYGRQIESFTTKVDVSFLGSSSDSFHAVFIRAPQIASMEPTIQTLIIHNNLPVMVRNERILTLAFHPELTDDNRIHRYFLENF